MGSRRISCRARDRLRQREVQPRPFVPTIGVEQLVLFTDKQARDYRSSMHDELGRRLGSRFRKRYKVLPPEQMKLTLIESSSVADQARKSHSPLRVEQARRIAYLLGERLEELMGGTNGVPLQIGEVTPFRRPHPRKPYQEIPMVGAYLFGWKGPKSQVATHDSSGRRQPLSIVREAGMTSARTIAEEHAGIKLMALAGGPRIPVVEAKHRGDVSRDEVLAIGEAVGLSMPEDALLSAPVLTVRVGAGRNDVEIITLGSTPGGFSPAAA